MQINDRVKESMGNWVDVMSELIQSKTWDDVFRFLKEQSQQKKVICPVSSDVFKSFKLVDRHKMKALIILQDPYPTFRNNTMIADGIPMSCSYTKYLQPSLYMWYQQIENEYGFNPDSEQRDNLEYLLKEEHIMLINSALTTEKDKSGSHQEIWQPVMQWYIENVINKYYSGLPIVLCGVSAQKLEKYINPLVHHIKKIEHPVVAAYQNRSWKADGAFKWIDGVIRANNGESEVPRWIRLKTKKPNPEKVAWVEDRVVSPSQYTDLPWQ